MELQLRDDTRIAYSSRNKKHIFNQIFISTADKYMQINCGIQLLKEDMT